MKIIRVRTAVTETEMPDALVVSHGTAGRRVPHVIVGLWADDGTTGIGEASPLTFFTGETVPSVQVLIDETLGPRVMGRDPREVAAVLAALDEGLPGHPAAKAAIDMALHDLVGKAAGLSVSALLGGALRDRVPINKAVGFGAVEEAVRQAKAIVALGLRGVKIKVGAGHATDVQKVRAIREMAGPGVELTIDANAGYGPKEAIRLARAVEPFDIAHFEQPVGVDDFEGMAYVRANTIIPVMADESVRSPEDALRLVRMQAADVFAIKLVKVGGLARARQILAIAEAAGVVCTTISPFETAIGVAANLHFAASTRKSPYCHGLATVQMFTGDTLGRLVCDDGSMHVPAGPGLGVPFPEHLF
jgi:L-Ala-D/L-Glu epimerase / N-acetyl-D-glutamate racemase